jgi:K+-transporting ATPase A subunit
MGLPKQAMEGKSSFWTRHFWILEHCYHRNSTGSVNSMHDSSMPVSGSMQLLAMMVNAFMVVAGRIFELLYFHHSRSLYFGINGGTNTRIFRKEN